MKTDLEISKALALAIGHPKSYVNVLGSNQEKRVWVQVIARRAWSIRVFDYRDWNVIGPIAEKFDCFPEHYNEGWYAYTGSAKAVMADIPQKAIALAVIGAKK